MVGDHRVRELGGFLEIGWRLQVDRHLRHALDPGAAAHGDDRALHTTRRAPCAPTPEPRSGCR
jgi:hypothetical protein